MARSTHTYVILPLSAAAYQEIREKLLVADYHHVFNIHDGAEVIDMHGIAVRADEETTRQ